MQKRNIMKRSLLLLAVSLLFSVSLEAQTMKNDNDLQKRVRELEDKAALKELVDTFSILSDRKDVRAQVQLFTANATVETYRKDVLAAKLTGRKEMEEAFGSFLKNFETVYHFNGQQTVTLGGDKASGVSYCMVTLIGLEGGRKMKTSIGVYYHDEYVRENGRRPGANKGSGFRWGTKRGVGA